MALVALKVQSSLFHADSRDILTHLQASERDHAPPELSFGWQRATLLGAFFNGVFLFALGVSIFLQVIERFITTHRKYGTLETVTKSFTNPAIAIQNPEYVMIIGCVGFALNVISITILHGKTQTAQANFCYAWGLSN